MFILPEKIFEQHMIVLGKTGAGKSSAIRSMAEHLLREGKRVVIITAKADWWGIKLAADGKHAGYPLVVFGGDHQDMPLHHQSGKTMAELLGTGNRSAVLQMRDFMPGERTQFWIDFAANLFRALKGKLFLIIDEVHNFAPKGKVIDVKAGQMLHWSNKLASEARGLGITLIGASQRPAKVHNDFLTSCETLIAMRVTTKWDRDAVKDWISGCGEKDMGEDVLNSLAQMKRGDAWGWSPEIEFGPKQIHFPMFDTYDSFRPQMAQDVEHLKGWADVNLEDVRAKLATVVREAEANDPAKLKARIRELETQMRRAPESEKDGKAVARAVLAATKQYRAMLMQQGKGLREIAALMQKINLLVAHYVAQQMPEDSRQPVMPEKIKTAPIVRAIAQPTNGAGGLSGPERKILMAMSQLLSIGQQNPPREMIAGWAGYSPNGGAFNNPIGHLRSLGYVEGTRLTESGLAEAGTYDPPGRDEIHNGIIGILDGPQSKILRVLLDANGEEMSRADLAQAAGYELDGGAFNNPLGALRTKGLAEYPSRGMVKATDWLFAV